MKALLVALAISATTTAFADCRFSHVELEESARHYRANNIVEDPEEALIVNGFTKDPSSNNVAYVSSKERELFFSAINPLTLSYELFDTVLGGNPMSGWSNAGVFKTTTKITIRNENDKVLAQLVSKKYMTSDGFTEEYSEKHENPKFNITKKKCN